MLHYLRSLAFFSFSLVGPQAVRSCSSLALGKLLVPKSALLSAPGTTPIVNAFAFGSRYNHKVFADGWRIRPTPSRLQNSRAAALSKSKTALTENPACSSTCLMCIALEAAAAAT